MGNGHGSEFHLLRYLGRHRRFLNREIEKSTGGRVADWLDFPCGNTDSTVLDSEWRGLDFVSDEPVLHSYRTSFWPQTGNLPNWDADRSEERRVGKECRSR